MNEDINTDFFKEELLKELAMVETELKDVGQKNPTNQSDWEAMPPKDFEVDSADENEAADKIEEYENNTAILKELEIKYNDLKDALRKIETGTYGICEISGEPIEKDRLEANPAARTCKAHM